MSPIWFRPLLIGLVLLAVGCQSGAQSSRSKGYTVSETNGRVRVEYRGQLVSEYHFREVSRPFLYPLLGPDGVSMTRRWPQEEFPGEEKDHPHHHALWWSHGEANGEDFWSESAKAGKTVHQYFTRRSGGDRAVIATRNRWISKAGKVIAEDERRMTFLPPENDARTLDIEVAVFARDEDLVLGDTKEGTMAIRIAESMRLVRADKKPGEGHILNSAGDRDAATWGKRAAWCDYSGPVEGRTHGIAIFDHPGNPRHPTWWHVRDYGLFAANPFGIHDFEKKPAGSGNLVVKSGTSITFRYRIVLHQGEFSPDRLEAIQRRFAAEKFLP